MQKRSQLHRVIDPDEGVRAHFFVVTPRGTQPILRSYHELVLVIRGNYHTKIHGKDLKGHQGDTFFFPAGSERLPLTRGDGETALLMVTAPKERIAESLPHHVHDVLGRLLAIGTWMKAHTDTADPTDPERLNHLFDVFIDEYRRLGALHPDSSPLLERAKTHMAASMEHGNLKSVAGALGVSQTTLNRAFRNSHDCTAQEWMQMLRAENALHLLQSGQIDMAGAAEAVGLSGPRSLGRLLKKHFGTSKRGLPGL